jgi:TRAP-type uncharacterized transport system substrate-binding protein
MTATSSHGGLDGKQVYFAGAALISMGTPWGTLANITRQALQPLGYEVHIESLSWGNNNPKYVSDGRAVLGATQYRAVQEALEGVEGFAGDPPRKNLRLIATINQPAWIGVAVRADSGITDLSQIGERQMPVRYKSGGEKAIASIFDYYGLSREAIAAWGGRAVANDVAPVPNDSADPTARWARDHNEISKWVRDADFDLIVDPIYAAYTPEHKHWWDASILHKLRFLPLPADLIQRIMDKGQAEAPGFIPHRLMRGIDDDVATVERFPQVIYTREEAPDEFIFNVTKALDENRHLFRKTHIPYSYDPATVAKPRAVPLHPGAERYYKTTGYLR